MAFDTIHQILITHTGKSMSSASDSIDYGLRSLYIYHFELGKSQNSWPTCLVRMSCSASCSHPDWTLWNCRSMLVEVLFNVGIISVSTDRPVDGWVFGIGIHRVPRSKVNLCHGLFDISSSDSLRSFLAMRVWRCMFRTPTLIHVI